MVTGENFGCVLMNMRICCYDLVFVDFKTLVSFLLFHFILFTKIKPFFGTRLGFD
jgi:hypothetical protein